MPVSDQGLEVNRYQVIPRVIILLRRGDDFLLLKGAPTKRLWAGKYNGIGGHLEKGEDPLMAANRELEEEAGIIAELWLCGVVIVDTDSPQGIGLFIFTGEYENGDLKASREGIPEWIPYQMAQQIPTVEDLPHLLRRVRDMHRGDDPFLARSFYNSDQELVVEFAE